MTEIHPVPTRVREGSPNLITDMDDYREACARASANPDGWWLDVTRELVQWRKEPTRGLEGSYYDIKDGPIRWFADGELNGSQRAYEVDVHRDVLNRFRDLKGGNALKLGHRYLEDFGAGGERTVSFVGPVEEGKRVELRTMATGGVNLEIPLSRVVGSEDATTSLTLVPGHRALVWEYALGDWWLKVD